MKEGLAGEPKDLEARKDGFQGAQPNNDPRQPRLYVI